jgi:hypothetical protein
LNPYRKFSQSHRRDTVRPWPKARPHVLGCGLPWGGEFDYQCRRDLLLAARLDRMLQPHSGDDVVAMLVEPLRSPEKKRCVVVSGYPELSVRLVVLDELDALPEMWEHSVRACRMACWPSQLAR